MMNLKTRRHRRRPVIVEWKTHLISKELKLRYAILAMAACPVEVALPDERNHRFSPHLLLIQIYTVRQFVVYPKDLNGVLCLEVRQQLLRAAPRVAKSVLDFAIAVFVFAFALILIPLIAIAIKLDSPGPVFYGQLRYGRNGQPFKAWKFRTMVANADRILDEHLAKHPELKEEWEKDQKLRNDPRITRVGKYLRKTSLDELPQVWNVIRGEMSIVGPRPIVQSEIEKYGKSYALYTKVKPGITGLWQVSGRNDLSYESA
jgi:lipopolysaccharide/colanic/teichoic acid biosynthesis glycosyltransferase